jgi:prepilin-type N-terminal cleavage/methylation domain-containing protein
MPCKRRWNVSWRSLARRKQNWLPKAEGWCHREAYRDRRSGLLTRHLQHQQGFTLLELVVSTLIMGVLAQLMAIDMLGHMPQRRLSGATQQMTWDLMRARMQAIKRRHNVQVTFVDTHTYAIWMDINKNGVIDSGEEEVKNVHSHYRGVNVTATNNITFNSRGASHNAATITLTNTKGSKVIAVNIAGFIKAS